MERAKRLWTTAGSRLWISPLCQVNTPQSCKDVQQTDCGEPCPCETQFAKEVQYFGFCPPEHPAAGVATTQRSTRDFSVLPTILSDAATIDAAIAITLAGTLYFLPLCLALPVYRSYGSDGSESTADARLPHRQCYPKISITVHLDQRSRSQHVARWVPKEV